MLIYLFITLDYFFFRSNRHQQGFILSTQDAATISQLPIIAN